MSRLTLPVIALFSFAALAVAEPPKTESLKEFVLKNKSRHAVGVYMKGKKVGYMITELDLGTYKGNEVGVESNHMYLSLSIEGETSNSQQKETIYYSLDGQGTILFAEQQSVQDKQTTVYTATANPKGMTLAVKGPGQNSTRQIPTPMTTLAHGRRLLQWLSSTPAKGATFENWTTAWEEDDVNLKEVYTYQAKKSMVWGGVRTDVHQVKVNTKGAIFDAEVLSNGNPIKGTIGGLLEMRAESEEIAKKLDEGGIDMIAASSIKVDQNLGRSANVTVLTLEAVGLKDFSPPGSHRQKLRRENGKAYLDLRADFRVDKPEPITDAERKKLTSATACIQCDDEKVKKLAAEIVGDATDPLKKADLIKSWVYKKLRKTMACNSSTTLGVLDTMAGDCTEHTLLFVSLARAAGLPARELTGVAHVDQIFGWHAWAEVHDGHQWVSVDPTWNELYVDATHIVFSHDSDDHSWLNILGNVSFKVVKVERKK